MIFSFAKSLITEKHNEYKKIVYDYNNRQISACTLWFVISREDHKSRKSSLSSIPRRCTLVHWMHAALQDLAAAGRGCINLNACLTRVSKGLPVWKSKDARRSASRFPRAHCVQRSKYMQKRGTRHALSPHPCHFDGGHPVS